MDSTKERTLSLRDNPHGFSGRPTYSTRAEDNTVTNTSPIDPYNLQDRRAQSPFPDSPSITQGARHSIRATSIRSTDSRRRDHTWSMSTTGDAHLRSSLDPTARPPSMQGGNADKPWIGTFRDFEDPEKDVPPVPTQSRSHQERAGALRGVRLSPSVSSSSGEEKDLKKATPDASTDSSAFDEKQKTKEDSEDPNLVDFDGPDDPYNPQNYPTWRKWLYTFVYGIMTFAVTFASSIFSTAIMPTSKEYGVSEETMLLGTSLFVLGFAWGPPVWGPLSELYGRKMPLFLGYLVFGIFNIPVAVAQNLQTIFVCRFFGGFFASAPLAVVGGALADLWDPVGRGYALCVFSGATFIGPAMGPIVGSFTVENQKLGWRWTAWITAIISLTLGLVALFIIPETFAPRLLHDKAKKLRFETKNWALHAKQDEQQISLKDIAQRYIQRPFTMMAMEPILVLITIYMSLIYGILYLFFEAFPVAFQQVRGMSPGVGSLPFISLLIGIGAGAVIIVLITKYRFKPVLERTGHVVPEERLVPMFVGGALLPAGLFWFAWTSDPQISVWPQIISIAFAGAGVMIIFLQGLNYLIDVYLMNANSAIAANTFFRSWVGAGFIMFATGMFHNLGVDWAASLLGFLCIALYPAPIVFYIYGHKIRSWSKFSPTT